ncbi:DUF5133 domain-containing protein [Streptomyces sp. NPDC047097]|uniref:DUF5133 domain-containing protein n=1 Tax=Streptomyces sp. NPDC047097 TaxID=3155260 RepID=UPI003410CFF4
MLRAHPATLRNLVERYEALRRLPAEAGPDGAEARQRLEDAAYTLCVTMGTRDPEAALSAARARLSADATLPTSRGTGPR